MTLRLILAAILLAAISSVGTSQEKSARERLRELLEKMALETGKTGPEEERRVAGLDYDVQTLVDVTGVYVHIRALEEDAKAAGLTSDQLQTDVELKLRQAGIKIKSKEEWVMSDDGPHLYVNVDTQSRGSVFVYGIQVKFSQNAYLARSPNRFCLATTWNTGTIGACGSTNLVENVRDDTKDLTDQFIKDYSIANPRN